MNISSVISEYNPFHQGHKYHLEETKKITGSDYTIVIMSGNFTQRGTPAILDKYARTRQALLNGADLVLELPIYFATASAEGFAFGAVSILEKLGVVSSLVFGSESGEISSIRQVADFLSLESHEYQEHLKSFLKKGYSFPKARAACLNRFLPDISTKFLSSPNNILGIEYCRALNYFHSPMVPMTICRKDNSYHDSNLSSSGKLSSATAIRKFLSNIDSSQSHERLQSLTGHLPDNSLTILAENWDRYAPITTNDLSLLLKYKLLSEDRTSVTQYLDITCDLADRIYNHINAYKDFTSFCDLLKTKELTHTRISRGLLHILLNIKKEDYLSVCHKGYGQYARILGFRKEAVALLHEIKKKSSIPLISKLSDAVRSTNDISLDMLQKDIYASNIYESVIADKFKQNFRNEFQRPVIVV